MSSVPTTIERGTSAEESAPSSTAQTRSLRERGVASLEYIGAALIAGVVIVGVAVGLGGSDFPLVRHAICRAVSDILQDDFHCDAAASTADDKLPDCEITSTEYSASVEGTVFSVNLGADASAKLAEVKTADGRTQYTAELALGGKLGAKVAFGEKGKFGLGEGLEADAGLDLTGKASGTWTFDSPQARQKFLENVAKEVAKDGVASQTGVAAPVTKWLLDKVVDSDPIEAPDEYYIEAGTQSSGSVTAAAGLSGKLSLDEGNVLGVKVSDAKSKEPSYTFYYKGTGELAAQLGVEDTPLNADGSFKAETVVGITYKNGKPVKASIETAGDVNSGFLSEGEGDKIPLGKGTGTPSVGFTADGTVKGKVSLDLDLTEPKNINALADALQSTGLPLLNDYGTPGYQDPVTAVGALADRFTKGGPQEGATISAQEFVGSTDSLDVGFLGGDLVAFGAEGKGEVQSLDAVDGYYYQPGTGMVHWRRCEK